MFYFLSFILIDEEDRMVCIIQDCVALSAGLDVYTN